MTVSISLGMSCDSGIFKAVFMRLKRYWSTNVSLQTVHTKCGLILLLLLIILLSPDWLYSELVTYMRSFSSKDREKWGDLAGV